MEIDFLPKRNMNDPLFIPVSMTVNGNNLDHNLYQYLMRVLQIVFANFLIQDLCHY